MSGNQVELITNLKHQAEVRGVSFVIIGGQAVMAYSGFRVTFDLDFCVRKQDVQVWKELCGELGYIVFHEQSGFLQLQAARAGLFPLDLMLAGDQTFDAMQSDAVEKEIAGVKLKVAAPRHLIAMKLHSLKNSESDRERTDVPDILELIKVANVSRESFKSLCDRFGTKEIYGKIEQHIR